MNTDIKVKNLIARMVADKAEDPTLDRFQRSMLRNTFGPSPINSDAEYILRWRDVANCWLVWQVSPNNKILPEHLPGVDLNLLRRYKL